MRFLNSISVLYRQKNRLRKRLCPIGDTGKELVIILYTVDQLLEYGNMRHHALITRSGYYINCRAGTVLCLA